MMVIDLWCVSWHPGPVGTNVERKVRKFWRRRELASTSRSGRYARSKAWTAIAAFLRRTWPGAIALPAIAGGAFVPLSLALKGSARAVPVTVGVVSGLWIYVLLAVVRTGAGPELMGASAESSTGEELRALARDGWRLVNGLQLTGPWDIDHVAVGPGGVLALESKWSGSPWPLNGHGPRFMEAAMANAATQACRNANDVAEVLSEAVPGLPVTPVVVLWHGGRRYGTGWTQWRDKRTVLVHGHSFGEWLRTLPKEGLTGAQIDELWSMLERRARERDEHDAGDNVRVVPTLRELATELGLKIPSGALGAILGVGLVFRTHDWRLEIGGLVTAVAVGVYARGVRPIRGVVVGWLLITVPMTVLMFGGLVHYGLTRS